MSPKEKKTLPSRQSGDDRPEVLLVDSSWEQGQVGRRPNFGSKASVTEDYRRVKTLLDRNVNWGDGVPNGHGLKPNTPCKKDRQRVTGLSISAH